jgi:hypothetical protein
LAPREHLVARRTKWATKLVEGLCPPVLHVPCHPPPPPPLIRLPEPEELPGGVRSLADQLVLNDAQAASMAAGPPSQVLGWVGMARVVLLCVCPSIHAFMRCKPCCMLHSAHLKLLFLGCPPRCWFQVVPHGACCLPLRAWATYSSALRRTCPSCRRGCYIGFLNPAYLLWKSLR